MVRRDELPALPLDELESLVDLSGSESIKVDPGDPDEIFDREWSLLVIERAIERLRSSLEQQGDDPTYELFVTFDMRGERPSAEEIGQRLGIEPGRVRPALFRARRLLRRLIT